jgi:hypothetical protein
MSIKCAGCRARESEIDRQAEVIAEVEIANDLLRQKVKALQEALFEAKELGGDLSVIAAAFAPRRGVRHAS